MINVVLVYFFVWELLFFDDFFIFSFEVLFCYFVCVVPVVDDCLDCLVDVWFGCVDLGEPVECFSGEFDVGWHPISLMIW